MKSKYVLAFFLVLPVLVLGGWILKIEHDLYQENTVIVRMRGYDPRDLLSGRYLLLQPDWDKTDCAQFPDGICPRGAFARSYRYYISEDLAPDLEILVSKPVVQTDMVFVYQRGSKPLVKDLLINSVNYKKGLNQFSDQLGLH